jgi:hypothetical protein
MRFSVIAKASEKKFCKCSGPTVPGKKFKKNDPARKQIKCS